VFANGVQRGFRVYAGRDRQRFQKLGLQPGDLVLAVNGTPLDDPQRGQEIFNTIGASDRVTITIERNGQPQELTLNTAQISLPDAGTPQATRGSSSPNPTPPAE
jgi:general secretion pathway protein C